jgi:hypothetical protein
MRRPQPSGAAFMTPVVDLLSLLTIAFLGLGILMSLFQARGDRPGAPLPSTAAARQAKHDAAVLARERNALDRAERRLADDLAATASRPHPDPADVDRRLAAATARELETQGLLGSLEAEIAHLSEAVARAEQLAAELPSLGEDAAARERELAEQKRRLEDARRKLADLEAAAAEAGKTRYTFRTGTPIVNRSRTATEQYFVVLSEGKVLPAKAPWYERTQVGAGAVRLSPAQAGLSIDEAVKAQSELMKDVTEPSFRSDGRVVILVMSDSFGAFRVLRDALVKAGVDYGWDPVESTTFHFVSSGGRTVGSQGGR